MFAHAAHGPFPMPLWLFVYAVAAAVLLTVFALRTLWPTPRLAGLARGEAVPAPLATAARWLGVAFRVFVFVAFAVTLAAAWFGVESTATNLSPTATYVAFWVGVPFLSVLVGDVWARANPLAVVGRLLDRVARRSHTPSRATGVWASHWPAAAGLFAFVWSELAYHEPYSVEATGIFLGVYVAVMLLGVGWFGSAWLRTADGFAVFFSFVAALSPLHRVDGVLRWRWPGSGLVDVDVRDGTVVVLSVVVGAVGFDGVARTTWWLDIIRDGSPWEQTLVNTLGLLMCVAIVVAAFTAVTRLAAGLAGEDDRVSTSVTDRWAPALVPVAFGLFVAHAFALLVIDGQAFWSLASDPFGWDWDLFGTGDRLIDPDMASAHTIAWVQVLGLALGHVAAVVAIHDLAVTRHDLAVALRSQWPLVALVLASAVGGLLLLL